MSKYLNGKVLDGSVDKITKRKHKPFNKWNADDYDMAANILANTMNLTSVEWSRIRFAIRQEVESSKNIDYF